MRIRATLLLSAALAAAAGAAAAQPLTLDLGEIVLSANRTATERARTGVSVAVAAGDVLEAAPGGIAAAALARSPGVGFTQQGPIGNLGTLSVRGADSRYIATFFEGIRIDDPSGPNVAFNAGVLPGLGLGRAEILRGSQSAVWGGSAVGGVLTLEGPRAPRDGIAQRLVSEGGGYGTAAGSYALTFRGPGAEMAFGLTHLRSAGFSAAAAGTEPDGAEITRATLTGRIAVTGTLTLGAALFAQATRQDYDGFDPMTFQPADAVNRQDRREAGARLFAEWRLGQTLHRIEGTAYTVERTFDEVAAGGTVSRFAGSRLGLAWRAETDLSQRLTLLYGADGTEERASHANLRDGRASVGLTGAYAQALWAATEALDLAVAVRADHNSDFGTFATGRLAAAFRPDAATTLRAAVATGFRAPSLDERFGVYPGAFPFVGNPALTPERSVSAEIGAERTLAGGARLAATAFLLDIDNLVTFRFGAPPAPATLVNLPGLSRRHGVEVEGVLPLGARVALEAAYTFTEAVRPDGARLPLVPRHAVAATLRADLTDRLRAALTVSHLSDRAGQFGGTAPDATVAAARLGLALSDAAELFLRVDNLADAVYELVPGYGTARRNLQVGLAARF